MNCTEGSCWTHCKAQSRWLFLFLLCEDPLVVGTGSVLAVLSLCVCVCVNVYMYACRHLGVTVYLTTPEAFCGRSSHDLQDRVVFTYRKFTDISDSELETFPLLRRKLHYFRINCTSSILPLNAEKLTPHPEVTFLQYFTLWSSKTILSEQPRSITYYPSKS